MIRSPESIAKQKETIARKRGKRNLKGTFLVVNGKRIALDDALAVEALMVELRGRGKR